ncbi:hypothetical protein [Photobacterium leiognathi]|uniref:Uncharacterized protein n=1 Tax=Photobacterium leiognathi TaxID=553611 RepID=A0ABX5GF69_PHOLE|nr:hypothetical protein [Photobacterium leiognathi]KJF90681.1 hypothetical protein UB42_07075 [Photobacterium leiognathi]PSV81667.1 hypothetical protein CTM94_11325 [Photobacterium leiognathi]
MLANWDWNWSWLSIPLLISFFGWICTFLFKAFDSHRVFKIKRYELIHNCFKDSDLVSTRFIVENTIKSIYKINIKYSQIVQLFENENSLKLFDMYRQSVNFIIFDGNGVKMKKEYTLLYSLRISTYYFLLYLICCISSFVLFYICYYFSYNGLFNNEYLTYNFVWALISMFFGILSIIAAFDLLINPGSVRKAKEFVQLYNDGLTTITPKKYFY